MSKWESRWNARCAGGVMLGLIVAGITTPIGARANSVFTWDPGALKRNPPAEAM